MLTSPRGLLTSRCCVGGEVPFDGLIALVLVAEDLIEVAGVEAGHDDVTAAEVIVSAGAEAREDEDEQQEDNAAADGVTDVRNSTVLLDVALRYGAIDSPFDEQNDANADEQERPPAAVPAPEIEGAQATDLDEKKDDADGDDQERANDGGVAHAAEARLVGIVLCAAEIALGAGLFFEEPALITPVLTGGWAGWRIGWRIASHGLSGPPGHCGAGRRDAGRAELRARWRLRWPGVGAEGPEPVARRADSRNRPQRRRRRRSVR